MRWRRTPAIKDATNRIAAATPAFMPADELTGAVAATVALSHDRQTLQIAPDILSELLRRRVAALWLFAQGFKNDGVQIAAEFPLEPFRHGRSGIGDFVAASGFWTGIFRAGQAGASLLRFLVAYRVQGYRSAHGWRRTTVVRRATRRAERRGGIRHWSVVIARLKPAPGSRTTGTACGNGRGGLHRLRKEFRPQQLGDSEVQQFRHPVRSHENIGGLQIAMNNQLLVHMLSTARQPSPR